MVCKNYAMTRTAVCTKVEEGNLGDYVNYINKIFVQRIEKIHLCERNPDHLHAKQMCQLLIDLN